MADKRSYEIKELRRKIMNLICENETLVRLLVPEEKGKDGKWINPFDDEDFDPTEELPYKYLMPYELVTGTLTEKGRYLGFDVSIIIDPKNHVFKDMTINFFVISEQTLIPYNEGIIDGSRNGYKSCWYDLVTCELDTMFSGTNQLGVGKMELVQNDPYFVSYAREIPYKGRTLTFKVLDYTDATTHGINRSWR